MKNWGWKNWLMFVLIALLFVAAGGGVLYGVLTHTEPGFTNPENAWDHAQLGVACTVYAVDEEEGMSECDVVENVVGVVNSRLGFDMLRWEGWQPGGYDIQVTLNAPVEVGSDGPCGAPGECFELRGTGATYEQCSMQTMNVAGGGDLQWLAVYHGLGHCLGLAHDDYNQSIMRPVQSATPDRTIPPWISDWDRELLRGKYGSL